MKKSVLLVITALVIIGGSLSAQDTLKTIKLSEIWSEYKFMVKSVRGVNSLSNGKEYTMIKKGSIVVYDYKTGDSVTTLVNKNDLIPDGSDKPIRIGSFDE